MRPVRARITSMGRYLPERILKNVDLEKMVETSDDWIRARTGIVERRIVEPGTPASAIALPAAREALERRGIAASELDLIIVATITPDMVFPATACILQDQLGANHAWGFDISAACSGFVYALTVGAQFISAGTHRKVLVVGADVMSAIVDYTDRTTCILFGDGAGAALLEPAEGEAGIFDFAHEADGSGATWISMVAGGSARPASHATVDQRLHFIRQDGQRVFKYAVAKMADKPKGLLQRNGLSTDDVDHLIAHQANGRILQAIGERMGLPPQKVIKNIERCGNTTAATIPLAMCSALDEGRFKDGDLIVLTSVGAGLTVGSMLMRWAAIPW